MERISSFSNLLRGSLAMAMVAALTATPVQAQPDCDLSYTVNSGCIDDNDGWASVSNIMGGTTPWTISWSTGASTAYVSGLTNGTYSVTVSDAGGCSVTQMVMIDCDFNKDDCQFRTQTPGGWGAPPNGNNPGAYLHANFASCFPNGLTIGCTNTLSLTSAQAITDFLPSGGSPKALPAGSLTDPGNSYNNVLAGQLVAATLSVGFDQCDPNFGQSTGNLSDGVIAYGTFMGWTVQELLDEANSFIGGCGSTYSKGQLNAALTLLNENYTDGNIDNGFVECDGKKDDPEPKSLMTRANDVVSVFPNPASDVVTVDLSSAMTGQATISVVDVTGRQVIAPASLMLEEGDVRRTTLDVGALTTGTYLIMVQREGRTTVETFQVTR